MRETARVGRRGTIVLPAKLRRQYGLEEGAMVIAEGSEYGVILRPAVVVPVELYTPERKAEFLLANAVDAEDRRKAQEEVRRLGVEPSGRRRPRSRPRRG